MWINRNLTSVKADLLGIGSFASAKGSDIISDCNLYAANTRIAIGIFGSVTLNAPSPFGVIIQGRINSNKDNDFISQLAIAQTGIYYRIKQSGTWGSWLTVQ